MNIERDEYNCWTCPQEKRTRGKTLTGLLAGRVSHEELTEYIRSLDDLAIRCRVIEIDDRRPVLPSEYESLVYRRPHLRPYHDYLESRGVSDDDILFYRIGACVTGQYAGRIVFPSFDVDGELNFFTSRKISRERFGQSYMTCDTSKDIVFNEQLIDWELPIVLVEGPFDMLAVGRNAIPLQGKMLRPSSRLFQEIVRKAKRVYVSLDKDAVYDQLAIAHLLYTYCVDVRETETTSYKDLGEMPRDEIFSLLRSARPFNIMSRVRKLCG